MLALAAFAPLGVMAGEAPGSGPPVASAAEGDAGAAPEGTGSASSLVPAVPPPRPGGPRVAGTAFIGWRGQDGETTGAVLTLSPGASAFVRLSGEATPRSELGSGRFGWAAGFEDARAGTFFATVADRGGVRAGDGFTLRRAEAAVGYKLPLLCGGPLCLAPTAYAAVPLAGGPYVGARTTLALGSWYVAGGLGWTIPGSLEARGASRWRIQYGLGRWDAQPGTLYVAYQDEIATERLGRIRALRPEDRQARGVLTAGVSWAQ